MPSDRRLALTVQYACQETGPADLPQRPEIRRWARAAFIDRPSHGGEVTIRFVDAEEGLALNRDYRGKHYATNVLSFAYDLEPVLAGDLVICPEVVAREAQEQGKPLAAHYAHLIVHGMLHLQGYEHENSNEDAMEMEILESRILAGLGISNPYASDEIE